MYIIYKKTYPFLIKTSRTKRLKDIKEKILSLFNIETNLKKKLISIINYLIFAILILSTAFTLSSDYIPPVRKEVFKKLSSTSKQDGTIFDELKQLTSGTIKSIETITENEINYLDKEAAFPHNNPFDIYIPVLDVKSIVYEGDFSKDSDLYKILLVKELSTTDGGKISLSYPGEEGMCLIAGHHLRSGKLFGALEYIEVNDDVYLFSSTINVLLTYKVTEILPYIDAYSSTEMFISREGESKLFLLTCSYRLEKPKTRFLAICELVDIKKDYNKNFNM